MIIKQAHTQFSISISALCRRFDIPRGSFYPKSTRDDSELLEKINRIASNHSAWGYRLIWAELRAQGLRVNHKKVYGVYCSANLQRPAKVSGRKHTAL
jgi:hypothetical protein